MSWQPEPQGLNELLNLLRDAIRPSDQALVQHRLASFNAIPDYNSYLIYILVLMRDQDNYTRAIAGLTLKNNLLNNFNNTQLDVLDHVKRISLSSLDNPDLDTTVRKTIGSVITAIVVRGQVLNWPEALTVLAEKLDSEDPITKEMALDTIQMICEDNATDLNSATIDNRSVLDIFIPRLIQFISSTITRFRVLAISATSHFVKLQSTSLQNNLTPFLQSLFEIALDETTEVRQEVCRSFVSLLENFTDSVLPYIDQLIEFMIFCHQSSDVEVAKEACDFWNQFAGLEHIHQHLVPFLPRVIPVILNSLIYNEEDLLEFGDDDEEYEDLQQPLHRFRRHSRYSECDEEEDEDDEDEEFFSEWTLRKLSATSLETLTSALGSQVTDILLPLLNDALFSQDWRVVESGILALGAAAEGGIDDISPYLLEMIPYLITNLSNPSAHVRYISCWTVSRFSGWIVAQCGQSEQGRTQFYEPVLRELLRRILDRSRRVQEAACSAFSTLEEQATEQELVPYLPVILNHLTRALRLYRTKNLRLLYDTIGTLAESVGSNLNESSCIAVLMPPLISKWNSLEDTDPDLFPLLTCLTDIATSLGVGFLPFTEPVFTRCVMLVSTRLQNTVADQPFDDFDDDEFIVVPLDLLSGIVQGLGHSVEPFVVQSTILPLLAVCAHYDSRYEVLQPTYALIGDLAKACFKALNPYLDKIMPELIRQLGNDDPTFKSVRNNAIWAIGEISMRWNREKLEPYVDSILRNLVPLIHPQSQSAELQQNAVNTLGRLGINAPEMSAHYLPMFCRSWLYRSRGMREDEEKDSAFQGFCKMVRVHPQALNEVAIRILLDSVGQWQNPSGPLQQLFEEVTNGYRGILTEEQWRQVSPYLRNNNNASATVQ